VAVSHSRMGTKAESDLVDCERMTLGHNHSEVKQDLAETHVTADVAVNIDKSDNVVSISLANSLVGYVLFGSFVSHCRNVFSLAAA